MYLSTIEEFRASPNYVEACKVYDIFVDFFGEEYVDLQYNDQPFGGSNVFILVYWPEVIVTNENNKSIHIRDLFAKIPIRNDGCMPYESVGFYLNRSTYTSSQYYFNYLHSHIPGIPTNNFTYFQTPCLGTGPIRNTITSLETENDDALWMLFCQELSLYVTVESLTGVPYRKLEEINARSLLHEYTYWNIRNDESARRMFHSLNGNSHFDGGMMKDFISYYIDNNHLCFDYVHHAYTLGTSLYDYIIDVSNAFIDYINNISEDISNAEKEARKETLIQYDIIRECIVARGKFFMPNCRRCEVSVPDNTLVCKFKGNPVYLKIDDDSEPEDNMQITTVLAAPAAMYILWWFLKIINYKHRGKRYGRKAITTTFQNVCYI